MTTEQRHSFRCPITDESQKAVLRIGKRELTVALTNQSAGGFSVTAPGDLRIPVGKAIAVRTSAGWFQAQVIHKQSKPGETLLGLVRLADLPDPRDAQLVKPGGHKFVRAGIGRTSTGSFLLVAIMIGLGFWGFLVNFTWFRGTDVGGKPVHFGTYLSRLADHITSRPKPARPAGTQAPEADSTTE